MDEAFYQLVRKLDYTWKDVMREKFIRTSYTLERLEEEAERKRKKQKEMERDTKKAKRKGP